MKKLFAVLIWIALSLTPAGAWPVHGVGGIGAQINIGSTDLPGMFINVMRNYGNTTFTGGNTPASLSDNGLPKTTLAANLGGSITIPNEQAFIGNTVQWKFVWPAGCVLKFTLNQNTNFVSQVDATHTGGAGGNLTVTTIGATGGNVVFTFSNLSASSLSFFYPTGFANSCAVGGFALYRVSDEADYLAGKVTTPEFRALINAKNPALTISGLNPSTIRVMGLTSANLTNETQSAYRVSTSTIAYRQPVWFNGLWSSSITGTDQYTAAAPSICPCTLTQGFTVQGTVPNPATRITISNAVSNAGNVQLTVSSSATLSASQQVFIGNIIGTTEANGIHTILSVDDATHITINVTFVHAWSTPGGFTPVVGTQTLTVTGVGTAFIANLMGIPVSTTTSQFPNMVAGNATFVYDALLNVFLYYGDGIQATVPVADQVAMANEIGANLWTTFPAMLDDATITADLTVIKNNLDSKWLVLPEYNNEFWNFQFNATEWGLQRGLALGIPVTATSNEPIHGYYGMRVRQIMGNLVPSVFSGQMSRVRRLLMVQASDFSTAVQNERFKGADLAASGTSTGVLNLGSSIACSVFGGTWNGSSCTNAPNYTQSVAAGGNGRPVDVVEAFGYAPYAGGTNICGGNDVGQCTPGANNLPFYQALMNAAAASDTATQVALIDNDIRQGTVYSSTRQTQTFTVSGTAFSTPDAHGLTTASDVTFIVTGGTNYSNLQTGALYHVNSTSSVGCPGSVTCNFTIQAYVNGSPSGASINPGTAGTGTVVVGSSPIRNMLRVANTWYTPWETIAASFDSDRPAGMAALRVEQYEGAIELVGASAGQCQTLQNSFGLIVSPADPTGAQCATYTTNALLAWRNAATAQSTVQTYFNQFMGLDPSMPATFGLMSHSKVPSWLVVTGLNQWSLMSGDILSTPFQTYYGFSNYRVRP